MKLMKFVIAMMIVLSVSGCGRSSTKTPGKRALEAMELIRDGKPKQLKDYVLKEDAEGVGFLYGMLSPALTEKGGVTRIEVESEKIDGNSATVKVRWYYKDGDSAFEIFPMAQEDGKWRIRL